MSEVTWELALEVEEAEEELHVLDPLEEEEEGVEVLFRQDDSFHIVATEVAAVVVPAADADTVEHGAFVDAAVVASADDESEAVGTESW